MNSKRIINLPYVFICCLVLIDCGLSKTLGKDIIHGKVSKVTVDNSSDLNDPLPSSLTLDMTLGGEDVHLSLNKDTQVQLELPIFDLSTDSRGKHQIRRAKLTEPEYAVYQSLEHEAAFQVFREKDSNGDTVYRLEGVVPSNGVLYDLKSKTDRAAGLHLPQRHRRAVPDGDSTNQADSSAAPKEGEEEDEEFEVDVLPQEVICDVGASSPPAVTQKPLDVKHMDETIVRVGSVSSPRSPSHPSPALPLHDSKGPSSQPQQRKKRQVLQDINIDVVAVADYGIYERFYNRATQSTSELRKQEALQNIRRYFAFIFNGVNLLYKTITSVSYTINVNLIAVIIASTPSGSPWTTNIKVTASPVDTVDASAMLEAAAAWTVNNDVLPSSYDHIMFFTGYDLTRTTQGVLYKSITGLAYTGTVCRAGNRAASVVEDLGGFQCIYTAAHELGHGLSAEHDGTENFCTSTDRYIMSSGTYPVTTTNKLNPWKFSSCTVNYFNSFFRQEVASSAGRNCLYNKQTINSNIPNVTVEVLGQLYDVDEQCRLRFGPSSRMCRGPNFGTAADVCTDLYCWDSETEQTCYKLTAARGTTCGNKKWCENGACVYNEAAPAADDSCVHGDQPGIVFDNQTCAAVVNALPAYCYQEVVRTRCCASCAKHYRLVRDCEYGDKAKGCRSRDCLYYAPESLLQCCGTCNIGTTFTTTSATFTTTTTTTTTPTTTGTTTTTTPTTTTTTPTTTTTTTTSTTTTTPTTTTTTPTTTTTSTTTTTPTTTTTTTPTTTTTTTTTTTPTTTTPTTTTTTPTTITTTTTTPTATTTSTTPTTTVTSTATTVSGTATKTSTDATIVTEPCLDKAFSLGNYTNCADYVNQSPSDCYNRDILSQCCRSCQLISTGPPGCEYGDQQPAVCAAAQQGTDAPRVISCSSPQLSSVCCKTCGIASTTGGEARSSVASRGSILLSVAGVVMRLWMV